MRNDISIDQLAARVRMAPNAFLRQFREITGSTPYQYLLQLRYSYRVAVAGIARFLH